jgi:hypothetical protein
MANRYWVGGTANWDATAGTKWDTVSGGSGGQSVPTNADDVFFDGGSGAVTCTITATSNAKSVTCTGFTGTIAGTSALTIAGGLTLVTGMTWSYTGSLTFSATGTLTSAGKTFASITKTTAATTLTLADNLTSTGTITLDNGTININDKTVSAAAFSSSNSNTRTLAFGSSGVLNLTGTGTVWNTGTGALLTTSGSKTVNVTSSGSTAISFLTGGMTSANAININFLGGTYSLSLGGNGLRDVDFTGFAGPLNNTTRNWVGNLKISTGMTLTAGTSIQNFVATTIQELTTNGKTFDFPITQNGSGGTLKLLDSLTMGATRTFTHTNGTLDLNGNTLTIGSSGSYATAAGTKNITFNGGILVCAAASATAFNNAAPTGFTTTAGTGAGEIRMTAAGAKTFVGAGSTFNCTLSNNGAGALTVSGSNTFTALANGVQPTTFTFTSGTTTTLTNWNINGTATNLVTINSSTVGSQHTLSKTSGTVSADYLSIQDSNATGGAAWYAGANSTDLGNNTVPGWTFTAPPAGITASMAASEVGPDTFIGSATITAAITAAMAASEVGPDILAANAFIGYAVTAAMAASEVGPDIFVSSAYIGTPPPPVVVDVYLIKLRSFTEHRRF